MNSRERILTTLRREVPDRVPTNARPSSSILKLFREKTGMESMEEYFQYDLRFVRYEETAHFPAIAPMKDFSSVSQLEEYPFPDVTSEYQYKYLAREVAEIKDRGLAVFSAYESGCFEKARHLRGMEKFLMDLLENEKFARALTEKILEINLEIAKKYVASGVDVLWIGDDIGAEKSMLISPKLWREYFKPCIARIIAEAKKVNPSVYIAYHSCGYIEPIIPELIEVGIDILQPVQPEVMDPAKVKREFGDKISFWGTVGVQSTLSLGSPDEVKKVIKERIETVGVGGGFIIAPAHTLESDVPWKNILAFFEGVREFGRY